MKDIQIDDIIAVRATVIEVIQAKGGTRYKVKVENKVCYSETITIEPQNIVE